MKIKKIEVEFVSNCGLRLETHTSTIKVGYKYLKNFSKTSIAKEFKIDLSRTFFMSVNCEPGVKYNFYNKRELKKNEKT